MDELTPNQLNRLTELLMNCAPFRNESQLRAMFIDPRLTPWQHLIPASSENFYDLIKRTIALLVSKRNRNYENALILFLDVLTDNIDEGDYCHEQVFTLTSDLRPILNIKPDTPHSQSKPQRSSANNRLELYTILEDRFDDGEIRGLCFELNVDYQNLPGETKKDKARELVLYMENRNGLDELATTMYRTRPDIASPPGKEAVKALLTEVPAQMHTVEVRADLLRLTLNGMSGKWTLHATNESDIEMNRVSVVLRPSPHVTVTPNTVQLGIIQPGQTRQGSSFIIIRPNQTATGDVCVLPFEVIYSTPSTSPKRYRSEFPIPATTQ